MKKSLIFTILIMLTITSVSGYNITRDIGESYISWSWDEGVLVNVIIDGKTTTENNSVGYYYLTGIESNEEHRIEIYNTTNTSERATDTARTLPPSGTIYILIAACFLIILIVLFTIQIDQEFYAIFFAVMGGILANYARSLCYKNWGLEIVFWIMIIAYIFLGCIAIYSIFYKRNTWF